MAIRPIRKTDHPIMHYYLENAKDKSVYIKMRLGRGFNRMKAEDLPMMKASLREVMERVDQRERQLLERRTKKKFGLGMI